MHLRPILVLCLLGLFAAAGCSPAGGRDDAREAARLRALGDSLRVELELLVARNGALQQRVDELVFQLGRLAAMPEGDAAAVPDGADEGLDLWSHFDAIEGVRWSYDSERAGAVDGGERALLAIGRREGGPYWLNLVVRHPRPDTGRRSPFPRWYVFNVDGRVFRIEPEPQELRVRPGSKRDWVVFSAPALLELGELAQAIASGDSVGLRVDYADTRWDRRLSAAERAGFGRMLAASRRLSELDRATGMAAGDAGSPTR